MPTEKAIEAARALTQWGAPLYGYIDNDNEDTHDKIADALDAFAEQARAQAIEEEAFDCHEHVKADVQKAVAPWRAALEALGDDVRYGKCWCAPFKSDGPHDPECLQARKLFEGETTENTKE